MTCAPRALCTVALLLAGCGSARVGVPWQGTYVAENAQERRGRALFARHCHECHPHGAAGIGTALNNKPLPEFAIRAQVRSGFGAMPAFDEEQLSDAELDDLVEWVTALRERAAD